MLLTPVVTMPQPPTIDRRVLEEEGPVCPLMVAMAVAGIPIVPVPGVGLGSVLATAKWFKRSHPGIDAVWDAEMEEISGSLRELQ